MNTFDNDTELLERLESCRERLHQAEDCAADLAAKLLIQKEELLGVLQVIYINARVQPNPYMGGATDVCAVPLADIESARAIIERYKQGK